MRACMCAYMRMCVRVCMCAYVYVCVRTIPLVNVGMHVRVRACMLTRTLYMYVCRRLHAAAGQCFPQQLLLLVARDCSNNLLLRKLLLIATTFAPCDGRTRQSRADGRTRAFGCRTRRRSTGPHSIALTPWRARRTRRRSWRGSWKQS